MSNYATINLVDVLARLPGVGAVKVFGSGTYSMRVWMDPQKLQSYGLQPKDVIFAIREQSQNIAAGQVGMPPAPPETQFQYTVDVQSRLNEPEQFGSIVIKDQTAQGGRLIHLRDIARIELGAQTYSQDFRVDGRPAAGIAIYQTPEANSLQVGEEIKSTMETLSKRFPEGLTYAIPYDTTIFVRDSIAEVYRTLYEAGILVLVVILVFLQNFRAVARAGDDRSRHHHRRFRRHGGARLHRQSLDPLRHRARDRHRGRRRDRDRGRRHEVYRGGALRARRGDPRDGRTVRADHRHHARADGGVHSRRLRARAHRQDVRAVRARDRRDRFYQRPQRRDAQADPMRAMAANARAAGKAQLSLSPASIASTTRSSAPIRA